MSQKLWAFLSNSGSFYYVYSPNMECHVTQDALWKNFYFVLILHFILGKVTKFLVEKLSTSEIISQKPLGGGGNTPVSLGLRSVLSKLQIPVPPRISHHLRYYQSSWMPGVITLLTNEDQAQGRHSVVKNTGGLAR